ncbi:hypothetical protein D3C77_715030 [compost metagenome]
MLLVAQRCGRNFTSAPLVLAQLAGEELEGFAQVRNRHTEARQAGGHAAVIVKLALATPAGGFGLLQLLLQPGDARGLLGMAGAQCVQLLLHA